MKPQKTVFARVQNRHGVAPTSLTTVGIITLQGFLGRQSA
jgi:hypothetical protein